MQGGNCKDNNALTTKKSKYFKSIRQKLNNMLGNNQSRKQDFVSSSVDLTRS